MLIGQVLIAYVLLQAIEALRQPIGKQIFVDIAHVQDGFRQMQRQSCLFGVSGSILRCSRFSRLLTELYMVH
jgi:hypothetical protein